MPNLPTPLISSTQHPVSTTTEVLAIGPWDRGEFACARTQIADSESWCSVTSCEAASDLLESGQILPGLILLAELLPGTYRQINIEKLRLAAPLAQIVLVAGSWCEGELRTGKPPNGVLRMYWYELAPWWHATQNDCTSWSSFLDGPYATRFSETSYSPELSGIAAIHTPAMASYEALAAALAPYGLQGMWVRDNRELPEPTTIAIWDGGQLDPLEFETLEAFAMETKKRGGSLLVLLDFPRKEHFTQLQKIGCTTIMGKPYINSELAAACGLAMKPFSPILDGRP